MSEVVTSGQLSPILMAIGLGLLSLLPFAFVIGTCFAKFSVVLALLRNALGTQSAPSNMILNGVAIILSLAVMAPVTEAMWAVAEPYIDNPIAEHDATSATETASRAATVEGASSENGAPPGDDSLPELARMSTNEWVQLASEVAAPWREFLVANSGVVELRLFYEIRDEPSPENLEDTPLSRALAAFLLTELAEAFQIGFLIFLPFLLVDLLIGSVLLALGMHMLTPTTVSLPFKLLLFVLVNGWVLLSENLILSYTIPGGL